MKNLSDKRVPTSGCYMNPRSKGFVYFEEDVKEFVREVLQQMDHLNEKFEAIAMRCNVETMAGDALCTKDDGGQE